MQLDFFQVAFKCVVDPVPSVWKTPGRIGRKFCRKFAPAREGFLNEDFLRAVFRRFFDKSDNAKNVESLGERERSLAAVESDNRWNADACERCMLALAKLLRLAAAQRFRDQSAPIEWGYSPRIRRHARLTISA
ncbi:hypothetical protein NLM33_38270 [Bradyrhizobium sp. CCGUVB1N3]|uniref:hypothetical protein n=1 Tax=Bradyrhizobium sp. CCGUVB1N3 TaxID=2949629 RepID=UPI0020B1C1D1|nr:hypothetical protein [Bradyrhizobium sp. CCGUVB1N3]MCP3476080.1 hypothetical protein [Bradyrhizobium sp. CCGUVB1N3]